jgi:hypothetical protein
VPALPIGARLVVDPWDGRLELLRSAAALPGSMREKTPLAITPLTPHLRYPGSTPPPVAARAPLPRASGATAVATAAEVTIPPMRDVNMSTPAQAVPMIPALVPVDLDGPVQPSPMIPGLAPVPDINPLPAPAPFVPSVQNVPTVEPAPDRCAIEGTDEACSAGRPR